MSPRPPHHLLVEDGASPELLIVSLPPGDARGPATELLTAANFLAGRGVRTFAFDLNLACHAQAPASVLGRWHEYSDAAYNVPETAVAIFRAWSGVAAACCEEIVRTAPARLAILATPAALRVAADLTSRLREAGFARPVYWFGPAMRHGLESIVPPGSVPAGFVVGDPERTLHALASGHERPPGLAMPGDSRFLPATPFQSLDALGLGELAGLSLEGYSNLQLPILMERGCVERCPHCPRGAHGLLYRGRPVASVYAEIERLHREKGAKDFLLGDTMAASRPADLMRLAERIRDGGLPITWEARYLAQPGEPDDWYRRLFEGGCRRLRFCLPTDPSGYALTPQLARALRLSWRAAIRTSLDTVVVGMPVAGHRPAIGEGEVEDTGPDRTFTELVGFLWENAPFIDDVETISDVLLLAGSALDRDPAAFGVDRVGKDPWRDWHDNGFLNREFRRKRLKELYLFLEAHRIRLPSRERVFGMGGPLLEQESSVRKRLEASVARPIDILLAQAPGGPCDVPPRELAGIAAAGRERGLRARIEDFNLELYLKAPAERKLLWSDEARGYWTSCNTFAPIAATFSEHFDRWAALLADSPAAVVLLHVNDSNGRSTLELLTRAKIRRPVLRVVLAGPGVAGEEDRQLFQERAGGLIEAYLVGDSELSMPEMVAAARARRSMRDVPGAVTYPDAIHAKECWLSPADPLDRLPFADYAEVDMTRYPGRRHALEWARRQGGGPLLSASETRQRLRSAASVVAELELLIVRHGLRDFRVELLATEELVGWLGQLAGRLERAAILVGWVARTVASPGWTREAIEALVAAGCQEMRLVGQAGSTGDVNGAGELVEPVDDERERIRRESRKAGLACSVETCHDGEARELASRIEREGLVPEVAVTLLCEALEGGQPSSVSATQFRDADPVGSATV